MQIKESSRSLSVILLLATIFLGGCLSRSPSPCFYALTPVQNQAYSSKSRSGQNAAIGIGPVKLADYLDESQIVTRTSDNQLIKAQFNRWVGSFKNNSITSACNSL